MTFELKHTSTGLSPVLVVFLSFIGIGGVLAIAGETGFSGFFIVLGVLVGGVAWIADTVFSWRRPLARNRPVERDPAVQILRERYARGEISESQFEMMLQRLNRD